MRLGGLLNLESRALQIAPAEIAQVRTPCILHWNHNHYVVLKRADPDRLRIHDPVTGVQQIAVAEALTRFAGMVLELWPAKSFERLRGRKASIRGGYISVCIGCIYVAQTSG